MFPPWRDRKCRSSYLVLDSDSDYQESRSVAAAHLLSRDIEPLVLECGDQVGASATEWCHVRFFSPWRYSIGKAAAASKHRDGRPGMDGVSLAGCGVARYPVLSWNAKT